MALNEFFFKNDIQTEFLCSFCKSEFDVPCGESICSECETKNFRQPNQQEKCRACEEYHEMPANGFLMNIFVQRLRNKAPVKVYRGEVYETANEFITSIGLLNERFDNELKLMEYSVSKHCDLLIDCVDLKTESVIDTIQKHREQFLNEIKEYRKQCLARCGNLDEFNKFMIESREKYSILVNLISRVDVNDKQINDVFNEINEMLIKINCYQKKLDIHVFGAQMFTFLENESEMHSSILGTLKIMHSGVSNLFQNKTQFEINYKTETEAVTYYNVIAMHIHNQHKRVCIAVSMSDNNEYYYLKLKLFSKDGSFIKEISERLYSGLLQFGATRIKDSIVIQVCSISGYHVLKSYNYDLGLVKTVIVNNYISTLFSDDERLYAYSSAHKYWTIYGENLNQLDSTALGDGTKYPFISNNTSQVELKYGRIFIYYDQELRVVDNETRTTIQTIKLNQKYANHNTIL